MQDARQPDVLGECLQLAASLGLHSEECTSTSEDVGNVGTLKEYVRASNQFAKLQCHAQQLHDHSKGALITDHGRVQQRTSQLRSTTDVLHQLANNSATLAYRFKDVNAKQIIPVEPEFQEELSSLILQAASNRLGLYAGQENLQWATSFADKPEKWEQHLQAVTAAHDVCKSYMQELSERGLYLTDLASAPL